MANIYSSLFISTSSIKGFRYSVFFLRGISYGGTLPIPVTILPQHLIRICPSSAMSITLYEMSLFVTNIMNIIRQYSRNLRDPFKFDIFHYNSIYLEQTSSQMQLNTRIVPGMILNNIRYVIGSLVHLNRKIEDFSMTVVG